MRKEMKRCTSSVVAQIMKCRNTSISKITHGAHREQIFWDLFYFFEGAEGHLKLPWPVIGILLLQPTGPPWNVIFQSFLPSRPWAEHENIRVAPRGNMLRSDARVT